MKRKRIALMTYAFDGRQAKGTALYARKLTERMLEDYSDIYEFTLVHFEPSNDPIYALASQEILIPKTFLKLPYANRFARFLLFCWRYRGEKFDIVHWFQPRLYPFFWLFPAHKIVVTAHAAGDITAPRSFRSFSRAIFNLTLRIFNSYIDAILAVSSFAREEIIEHYRANPQRVHVTYNGGGEDYRPLDAQTVGAVLKKYNIEEPYVLSVARFQPHKNVESLVRGYSLMRECSAQHKGIKLVLVGQPVHRYRGVEAAINNSQHKKDIIVVPYVEPNDLNAVYSGASVFAFLSLNEGFGLPVIEAMASGTPTVIADTTSLPEIAGGASIVVAPNDIEAIAEALTLAGGEKRESLVEKGLLQSRSFTWGATARATVEIYKSIVHE